MLYTIILSSISFIFFLVLHVVVFHKLKPKRRFRALVLTAALSLIFYSVIYNFLFDSRFNLFLTSLQVDSFIDFLNGGFVYIFICFFYFHLMIVFDSSVTTRIMAEIAKSRDKRLTITELKSAYSLEDKFKREFKDMNFLDRIVEKDGFYVNTAKGQTHARVMEFLRDYLHIGGHQ